MSNELVGEDEALEAGRHQGAEAVLAVAEDQHVLDAGEVLHEGGNFFGTAGHAGRGKAVRQHTTRGKDRDAQDVRLDGIAGAGIDRVGNLLAIHELEVAVVARGSYAPCRRGKLDAHLELLRACRSTFDGLIDADDPGLPLRIHPLVGDLPAELDEVILRPLSKEHAGDEVRAIALRYGGEVHLHPWIGLDHAEAVEGDLLVAHEGTDAIDGVLTDAVLLLEAKAPKVDEGRASHVVATARLAGDLHRLEEDFTEHRVGLLGLVAIDRRDKARRVERVERMAEGMEGRVHRQRIVRWEVVLDGEGRREDFAREAGIVARGLARGASKKRPSSDGC